MAFNYVQPILKESWNFSLSQCQRSVSLNATGRRLNSYELDSYFKNLLFLINTYCQYVGGIVMEEKIYSQFSTVSAGDIDSLMNMYANMDYCMNLTGNS
jgi:hypothetical protein